MDGHARAPLPVLPFALGPEAACARLLRDAGVPPGSPWARAAAAAARATEAWCGHAYHSAAHHADVAACAAALAAACRPAPGAPSVARLLAAAFGHDLGYDPSPARDAPFLREAATARLLAPLWAACGVPGDEAAGGLALVLATAPVARPWLRVAGAPGAPPPPAPLSALASDPELLGLARILSDADLAPSAGFSPAAARRQTALLAREAGRAMGDRETLGFLEHVVGPEFLTEPGRALFGPGLAAIRAELCAPPGRRLPQCRDADGKRRPASPTRSGTGPHPRSPAPSECV